MIRIRHIEYPYLTLLRRLARKNFMVESNISLLQIAILFLNCNNQEIPFPAGVYPELRYGA
jgi:hypothetical protein